MPAEHIKDHSTAKQEILQHARGCVNSITASGFHDEGLVEALDAIMEAIEFLYQDNS